MDFSVLRYLCHLYSLTTTIEPQKVICGQNILCQAKTHKIIYDF